MEIDRPNRSTRGTIQGDFLDQLSIFNGKVIIARIKSTRETKIED
jgi:hypothetical protein